MPSDNDIDSQAGIITKITQWVATHQEFVFNHVMNVITAFLILIIGVYLARGLSVLLNHLLSKKGLDTTIVNFISTMLRYILLCIVFIASLSHIGIQTASFIALIGAAGLAIGLALKGYLSDFASGILLVTLRPFKKEDYIEAAGVAGAVDSIRIFNTTLITVDNKYIYIPNSSLLNGNIINYSRKETRRIDLVIRVSYQADLKKAKQILEKVVLANEHVLSHLGVQIAVAELSTSSVNIVVRPWVKSSDYWNVRFALIESIKNALQQAEIEIPYPQLDLHRK